MRWWQIVTLAAVVLFYSAVIGWKEHEVGRAEAERDRLAEQLSWAVGEHGRADEPGDEVWQLKDYASEVERQRLPPRGPYPDGQSDGRLDPWRPGTRQVSVFSFAVPGSGVCAVTVDPPVCAAGPLVRGLPSPPTAGEVPHP